MQFNVNKVKIFVTIPLKSVEKVRSTVCKSGAGIIGKYSFCTFSSQGKGTFKPGENAKPFIGKQNNLEFVDEEKLEFICEISKVKKVLTTIRKNHPYEEPAIDIVPLINENDF